MPWTEEDEMVDEVEAGLTEEEAEETVAALAKEEGATTMEKDNVTIASRSP